MDESVKDATATARKPKSRPGAAVFTGFVTLLLLGAAAVAIHDILVYFHQAPEPAWFAVVTDYASRITYGTWVLPVGIVLALLGLWALLGALIPAGVSHIPLRATSSVWASPVDICRMCTASAQSVLGVTKATTVFKGKKVTVTISTAGPATQDIVERVQMAVTDQLQYVDRTLTLTVRPLTKGGQA